MRECAAGDRDAWRYGPQPHEPNGGKTRGAQSAGRKERHKQLASIAYAESERHRARHPEGRPSGDSGCAATSIAFGSSRRDLLISGTGVPPVNHVQDARATLVSLRLLQRAC